MSTLRYKAAAAAGTLYFICGPGALPAEAPVPAPAGPESVQLVGVLLVAVGGRPRISVGIGNRTDRLLWLRITVDAGREVVCEDERLALRGMKIEWFACAVDPVVEGRAYPVRIEIYGDEWSEEPDGVKTARPVFTRRDIQQLQPKLRP